MTNNEREYLRNRLEQLSNERLQLQIKLRKNQKEMDKIAEKLKEPLDK